MFRYPMSNPGIFKTIQGEGELLGVPMVFVRLGGCSVNCVGCDTNYKTSDRLNCSEIQRQVSALKPNPWIWVTGGEPTDYDLGPLLECLRLEGKIALVTSGRNTLMGYGRLIDFLCVSPHGDPSKLQLVRGAQVNLVPGLGGTKLEDWEHHDFSGFAHKYITPIYPPNESSVKECLDWIDRHPDWKLGVQAHKTWNIL